jgi:predicted dithiol-disulfide oxidoreductase (DUF899 family)
MTDQPGLVPAEELAARNTVRFPNESAEYRDAREALLAEEIELRRHLWRVAEQRRDLPEGGEINEDYQFEGKGARLRCRRCSVTTTLSSCIR